jgi:ribA/ribD-fused uncharacterized protein
MIRFTTIRGEFGWMSNMSDHSITDEGTVFPRAEHWFICSRFGFDSRVVEAIIKTPNPIAAKKLSKKIMTDRPDLLTVSMLGRLDVRNMIRLIQMKIDQHPRLKYELMLTHDRKIIEDVSKRVDITNSSLFWGAALLCNDQDHVTPFWVGENKLGEIWMELRGIALDDFFNRECKHSHGEQHGFPSEQYMYLKHIETGITVYDHELAPKQSSVDALLHKLKLYYA